MYASNHKSRPRLLREGKKESGNTIIESALALVVFLMMLFGIMDLGRMVWTYNTLSQAARVDARYAIVHGNASGSVASSSDVSNVVRGQVIGLDPSTLVVTTTWTPDKNPGSAVKVQTSYSFAFLLPYLPNRSIALGSFSQMVISR
jgi:Flp pilus assembly protein TadG